jgi:hypothetical protein
MRRVSTTRGATTARRAVRDGAVVAGLLFTGYLFAVVAPQQATVGFDAFGYWSVDPAHPYQAAVGGLSAFNYSPAIARLFGLFSNLDWYAFLWTWLAILVGTVIWLGGRGPKVIWLLAFPPVALELYHANIHLLIAAAIVLGFRYPWTWAFILLTKVTPGVGLVWFAVRREWRSLAIALGVTAAITAVSVAVDWHLWVDWLDFLGRAGAGASVGQFEIAVPLWLRLPAAVALVAWGGLTDRRWTVVVAATLGLPILWPSGFAICAALAIETVWRPAARP